MPKVRPADGIPVMPHIEERQKLATAVLNAKYEELIKPLAEWGRSHPHLMTLCSQMGDIQRAMAMTLSREDKAAIARGIIIQCEMCLAMLEIVDPILSTKQ